MAIAAFIAFPEALLCLEGFEAAWEKWLAYRRERRLKAYKPIGLDSALKDLAKLPDPIAAIENSIAKSYQGIYPPKAKSEPAANGKPTTMDITRQALDLVGGAA